MMCEKEIGRRCAEFVKVGESNGNAGRCFLVLSDWRMLCRRH